MFKMDFTSHLNSGYLRLHLTGMSGMLLHCR